MNAHRIKELASTLYIQVLVGLTAGVLLGHFYPAIGVELKPLGDLFIKMIRMVLAPIIFASVVVGIARMGSIKETGRVGANAEVVSKWTGVPVSRLMEAEAAKLIHLEDHLHERVIGQDDAVTAVANAIRRSRAGLSDPHRPIGSFLFLGPTGVGKTELARALADFLFDDEQAMVRIDMSEYMEKFSVSRLIGAPPGYVGYDEGGQLTEAVRRRPYSVVLLDEIDKAHPDVFNVLLQVLDDGRLTDGQGRTVDFTNSVLIMTSNLQGDPLDFFKPEFVNRVDDIIRFRSLTPEDLTTIVGLQLGVWRDRLAQRRIALEVSDEAMKLLAIEGFDPAFGARPLKRVIQREIGDPAAMLLLDGKVGDGGTITVDVADGVLVVSA